MSYEDMEVTHAVIRKGIKGTDYLCAMSMILKFPRVFWTTWYVDGNPTPSEFKQVSPATDIDGFILVEVPHSCVERWLTAKEASEYDRKVTPFPNRVIML